jgi:PIN domain nuclease of toxin-antitoxin system
MLLDTHALIWWLGDDLRLGPLAREAVATADAVFVSSASAWEMSIKSAAGKLELPADLPAQLHRHRFSVLPVHLDHALRVASLPSLHRDPFDRMLIAQAQVEQLSILSRDRDFAGYDVHLVDAAA